MIEYLTILLETGWPILVMFLVERFLVLRCLRTPAQRDWVRRHRWLHPNALCYYRLPAGLISVALFHYGYPQISVWFFAFWMITDLTDGDIARRCDLSTETGETLDPLSDKMMYLPPLVYFAWTGVLNPIAVALFVVFDVVGQFSRFFISNKAANLFGKAKTFLVVILLIAVLLDSLHGPLPHTRFLNMLLNFCVGLAFCSTAFKVIPNYWYANCLSLMNLVCGVAGIVVILMGKPAIWAFGLVFLGQFLDLFDGRAAERWGSTPKGEVFDDVADGTSFGITVALIVAVSFDTLWVGATIGFVHFGATAYRLVRFVVEKRKAGVEGGVAWFSGMPSPGAALVAGSTALLLPNDIVCGAIVLIGAFLMISRVPYAHFGRKVLPMIPRIIRVVVLVSYIILLALAVRTGQYLPALVVVFSASIAYMLSPLYYRKEEGEA